jgi:cellulose synthase/poly-beta-1,6-N-acetylglucosamine synthase-like glycosyltransferase
MWGAYVILAIAVVIVIYTLVGYPAILALARSRKAPPVQKTPGYVTTVSVILAVHNGAAFIRAKLDTLLGLDFPPELVEILVVSDGSTDETEAIVRSLGCGRVRLLRMPSRSGKAAALNAALEVATGEIVFFTDVRQPLDPKALRSLVENFADPTVGVVTGELRLLRGDAGEQADMDLYWRYEVWARQRQSEIDSLFNTTGCIYAVRRSLVQSIPADTLTDDAVIPLRTFFDGYRVIFDPTAIAFDYPALAGTEFRRRMRTLAGLWQVHLRFPQLFLGRNRMRFHFLSHKFSRLVLPWAILAGLVSSVALPPSGFRTLLLSTELLCILLAAIDRFLPSNLGLRRLTSPARTFFTLNLAAAAAIAVFFVPANRLWVQTRVKTQ